MSDWHGANQTEQLRMDHDDGIVTLSFNQPERRNAINPDMRNALRESLIRLMRSDECRAIVIAGVGGHFSAGGDISQFGIKNLLDARARQAFGIQTIPLIAEGPKPVIAAIEGSCFGMAMGYAMACDYVVAASDAKISAGATRIGLTAEEHGLTFTVPKRVGWGTAKKLLMLSTVLSGEEAGRIGLVDEVTAPGGALQAAQRMAREFAAVAPAAFALTKMAMAEGLQQALRTELDHQSAVLLTRDHEEGKQAFREKRKPQFTGD